MSKRKASNRWILIYKESGIVLTLHGSYKNVRDISNAMMSVSTGVARAIKLPKYAYHPGADGELV